MQPLALLLDQATWPEATIIIAALAAAAFMMYCVTRK